MQISYLNTTFPGWSQYVKSSQDVVRTRPAPSSCLQSTEQTVRLLGRAVQKRAPCLKAGWSLGLFTADSCNCQGIDFSLMPTFRVLVSQGTILQRHSMMLGTRLLMCLSVSGVRTRSCLVILQESTHPRTYGQHEVDFMGLKQKTHSWMEREGEWTLEFGGKYDQNLCICAWNLATGLGMWRAWWSTCLVYRKPGFDQKHQVNWMCCGAVPVITALGK